MSIKYFAFAFAIVGIFVAALVVASGDPATGRAQEAEASSPMPQLYWVDTTSTRYALPTSTAPNCENCPRRWVAPLGDGVHVAFTVPARTRVKHVWAYWGAVSGQLRPALAAQHRLGRSRGRPNPVQASARAEARGVA